MERSLPVGRQLYGKGQLVAASSGTASRGQRGRIPLTRCSNHRLPMGAVRSWQRQIGFQEPPIWPLPEDTQHQPLVGIMRTVLTGVNA